MNNKSDEVWQAIMKRYEDRTSKLLKEKEVLQKQLQDMSLSISTESLSNIPKLNQLCDLNNLKILDEVGSEDEEYLEEQNIHLLTSNNELTCKAEDLKSEIENYSNGIQKPMQTEIVVEREKNSKLEKEVRWSSKFHNDKYTEVRQEIDFLKAQLEIANTNLTNILQINKNLRKEINLLNASVLGLQEDLMKQKIGESKTIALLAEKGKMKKGEYAKKL